MVLGELRLDVLLEQGDGGGQGRGASHGSSVDVLHGLCGLDLRRGGVEESGWFVVGEGWRLLVGLYQWATRVMERRT